MQKKTEGICFAISAGICWGSMGVAAQVLMEDSGFAVGDLVAGRLLGAGALLLMFEHFFMRRSLLKYFSQPGVAKDILLPEFYRRITDNFKRAFESQGFSSFLIFSLLW